MKEEEKETKNLDFNVRNKLQRYQNMNEEIGPSKSSKHHSFTFKFLISLISMRSRNLSDSSLYH